MFCAGRRRRGAVYDRARLEAGAAMHGPALIVDAESTTFLPPGYLARVDAVLNIIVAPERGRDADA
jgi:N-methylhydantoinase A/oxoprolinase/acetone carboxylase beta subunit